MLDVYYYFIILNSNFVIIVCLIILSLWCLNWYGINMNCSYFVEYNSGLKW